jgi:fumarylpyruvate hydrolase
VTPKSDIGLLEEGSITLDVNGKRRQTGDLNQMAYQTVELIRFLSTLQELKAGDIVYTGTPSGVGSVVRGDLLTGQVDRLCPIEVRII